MTQHIHGMVITHYGTANNNRGVSEGNTTTLPKTMWKGQIHTTVSPESERYAIREYFLDQGLPCNRHHQESDLGLNTPFKWADPDFKETITRKFIDIDTMGFMATTKGDDGVEAEDDNDNDDDDDETGKKGKKKKKAKAKGTSISRTSRFSVNRAISLDPWAGDVSFNAASPGATPGAVTAKAKGTTDQTGQVNPVLYGAEFHNTRYQYPWTLTPSSLLNPEYAKNCIMAVSQLSNVGGNHSRYLYDFSPDTLLIRITEEPCARFNYCFESTGNGEYSAPSLLRLVKSGDILPSELYIGGYLAAQEIGQQLKALGCHVFEGVRQCAEAVIQDMEKGEKPGKGK